LCACSVVCRMWRDLFLVSFLGSSECWNQYRRWRGPLLFSLLLLLLWSFFPKTSHVNRCWWTTKCWTWPRPRFQNAKESISRYPFFRNKRSVWHEIPCAPFCESIKLSLPNKQAVSLDTHFSSLCISIIIVIMIFVCLSSMPFLCRSQGSQQTRRMGRHGWHVKRTTTTDFESKLIHKKLLFLGFVTAKLTFNWPPCEAKFWEFMWHLEVEWLNQLLHDRLFSLLRLLGNTSRISLFDADACCSNQSLRAILLTSRCCGVKGAQSSSSLGWVTRRFSGVRFEGGSGDTDV